MREPKPAIEMIFCGNSAAEVTKHVVEFATLHGSPLANAETEALLKELRDRLAKNGQVVKVVPFADESSSHDSHVENASTPKPRGRPRKPVDDTAKEPPKDAIAEAEKTIAENVPEKPADAELVATPAGDVFEVLPAATLDEVKRALNEFAAINGQVEARRIMSEQGGSAALKDVPVEKYRAVIHGLQEFKPAAMAA